MTRTRWLLVMVPSLAPIVVWAVLCLVMVLDQRVGISTGDLARGFPSSFGPLLFAALLLPLAAVVPAWPLRRWLVLLVPALYVAVIGGWTLAFGAVEAWESQLPYAPGPAFDAACRRPG